MALNAKNRKFPPVACIAEVDLTLVKGTIPFVAPEAETAPDHGAHYLHQDFLEDNHCPLDDPLALEVAKGPSKVPSKDPGKQWKPECTDVTSVEVAVRHPYCSAENVSKFVRGYTNEPSALTQGCTVPVQSFEVIQDAGGGRSRRKAGLFVDFRCIESTADLADTPEDCVLLPEGVDLNVVASMPKHRLAARLHKGKYHARRRTRPATASPIDVTPAADVTESREVGAWTGFDLPSDEHSQRAKNADAGGWDYLEFTCSQCARVFDDIGELKEHCCEHHSFLELHVCDVCAMAFPTYRNLGTHYKVHTRKVTKCDLCPKVFYKKSDLKAHVARRHYPCRECPLSFLTAVQLLKHMKTHIWVPRAPSYQDQDVSAVQLEKDAKPWRMSLEL